MVFFLSWNTDNNTAKVKVQKVGRKISEAPCLCEQANLYGLESNDNDPLMIKNIEIYVPGYSQFQQKHKDGSQSMRLS